MSLFGFFGSSTSSSTIPQPPPAYDVDLVVIEKEEPHIVPTVIPTESEPSVLPSSTDEKQVELPTTTVVDITDPIDSFRQTLLTACRTGNLSDMKNIIEKVRHTITPDDYDEYLLTASKNNQSEIYTELAKYNFYPLDFNHYRDILLIACETGDCVLFDTAIKNITLANYNTVLLIAIKYKQVDLVSHILKKYPSKINNTCLFKQIDSNKYGILALYHKAGEEQCWYTWYTSYLNADTNTITFKDKNGIDCIFNKTDPFVIKMEDPLIISQTNIDMFNVLAPVFLPNYTEEQKTKFFEKLVATRHVDILISLKKYGCVIKYDRKYFTIAKSNPHVKEVTRFLVEYFQQKEVAA